LLPKTPKPHKELNILIIKPSNMLALQFRQQLMMNQMLLGTQTRLFAKHVRKVGHNDLFMEERHRLKRFGMKRRFYDNIPTIQRDAP